MSKNNSTKQVRDGGQIPQTCQSGDQNVTANNAPIPREQLIAEAAYFRAEQRGFHPGSEMADWFEAEADVDRMLGCDQAAVNG